MGQQLRTLGLATVLGLGTLGVSGCDFATSSTQDSATIPDQISSIRLDSDSGGVTITGKEGVTQVSLQRTVSYSGNAPSGTTYHVENGQLVLNGCGQHCTVDYTLTVPAKLPVSGSTTTGRITLSDMGSVDVSTHSGQINMDTIEGPVKAQTTNGRIQGQGIKGDSFDAETSNGEVNVTFATPQNVHAQTSNGAINLFVPSGAYNVITESHNGHKDIQVTNSPTAQYKLDLHTSNGHITVKPSPS
jgi:hypothetical protein